MARSLSRREIALVVVLGAVAVGYLWIRSGRSAGEAAGSDAIQAAAAAVQNSPVVRMDLLQQESGGFSDSARDLFQYSVRPPTAEELARLEAERRRQREQAEMEARLRAEAAERERLASAARAVELARNPPKPQPPPINLKYLGYIGPKDDKIAVFEDGEEILVGKRGDVLKGQYRVVEVKYETVVMGYTSAQFKDATRELSMGPSSR